MIGPLPIKSFHGVYLLGSYEFNTYLIRGKKCALIEGGVSNQFLLILRQLEYLEISPNDIDFLVILHSHADHIMSFPPLQEHFPWMQIAAFEGSKKVFNDERLVNKFKESDLKIAQSLYEAGMVDGRVYHSSSLLFPMNLSLREGDQLELGERINLRVLETPGHAPDNISIYLGEEKVLFVSDAVGIYYPPDYIKPNFFYDLSMHQSSLLRIQEIGAKVLCKGHQGMVIGEKKVQDYIQFAFNGIEKFKRYVQEALLAGKDEEEVSKKFTNIHQWGISAFFPWESNFRLSRLLIKRTLGYFDKEIRKNLNKSKKDL
jgi:glyoxylase-like metal-dependent hydrolase (beta-lactamase superfamily II)